MSMATEYWLGSHTPTLTNWWQEGEFPLLNSFKTEVCAVCSVGLVGESGLYGYLVTRGDGGELGWRGVWSRDVSDQPLHACTHFV